MNPLSALWARLACLFWGHRYSITNRTRAGIYAPRLVCARCGRDRYTGRDHR